MGNYRQNQMGHVRSKTEKKASQTIIGTIHYRQQLILNFDINKLLVDGTNNYTKRLRNRVAGLLAMMQRTRENHFSNSPQDDESKHHKTIELVEGLKIENKCCRDMLIYAYTFEINIKLSL